MFYGLANYILMFGILLSNSTTVVYVYPIFLEYIITYELKNTFSTFIICKHLSVKLRFYKSFYSLLTKSQNLQEVTSGWK